LAFVPLTEQLLAALAPAATAFPRVPDCAALFDAGDLGVISVVFDLTCALGWSLTLTILLLISVQGM